MAKLPLKIHCVGITPGRAQCGRGAGSCNRVFSKVCACLQIEYPEIEEGSAPRHRFMSAFEQRKEATDRKYQVREAEGPTCNLQPDFWLHSHPQALGGVRIRLTCVPQTARCELCRAQSIAADDMSSNLHEAA